MQGSGTLLTHSDVLWEFVNDWLLAQPDAVFIELLPPLWRTFGSFSAPERCELGARVAGTAGAFGGLPAASSTGLALSRARRVLPVLHTIFGTRALETPLHDE